MKSLMKILRAKVEKVKLKFLIDISTRAWLFHENVDKEITCILRKHGSEQLQR